MPRVAHSGIVERLDRTTRTAYCQLPGSAPDAASGRLARRPVVPARYNGDPPAPLSYVDLDQPDAGVWKVRGPAADRRIILREDFALSVRDGFGTIWADTVWRELTSDGLVQSQSALGGIGVVEVDSGSASTVLTKESDSIVLDSMRGYWMAAEVAISSLTSAAYAVGFSDDAATTQAIAGFSSALGNQYLLAINGGLPSTLTLNFSAAATFYVIDIVLIPGEAVVTWFDGAGPYIITTNVPDSGDGMQPYLLATTTSGASKKLYVDWVRVEAFQPIASPMRDLVLPASSIVA